MNSLTSKIYLGLSGLLIFTPSAFARAVSFESYVDGAPKSSGEFIVKAVNILSWLRYGLFLVAAFLILHAAYDFLFSKGVAEEVKKAQDTLLYAIVAIVVGLLAGGLPSIVKSMLGL